MCLSFHEEKDVQVFDPLKNKQTENKQTNPPPPHTHTQKAKPDHFFNCFMKKKTFVEFKHEGIVQI